MQPKPPSSKRPDYLLYTVRFICGAIVGFLLAFSLGSLPLDGIGLEFIIISLIFILICGGFAARFGDKFWEWLSNFLR